MEALREIDENVKDLSQLAEYSDRISKQIRDFKAVYSLFETLKQKPSFERIHSHVKKIEDLQYQLYVLQQTNKIEQLSEELRIKLADSPTEAYYMYKTLKELHVMSPHVENVLHIRLESAKEILVKAYKEEFVSLCSKINWPFQSKGAVIAVNSSSKASFLSLFSALYELSDIAELLTMLTEPILERITYHFLGDTESNRIDKPEWMFTYILTTLVLHLDFCVSDLEALPISALASFKHSFITETCNLAKERVLSDLHYILSSSMDNPLLLFGHYLDEILKFDTNISRVFGIQLNLIDSVHSNSLYLEKWKSSDIQFLELEFPKIFDKTWTLEEIIGNKFNNLRSCILLYNSLINRYSCIPNEQIKKSLIHNIQSWLFPRIISAYKGAFKSLRWSVMHIESNVELWKEIFIKFSALYLGLGAFQQFLTSLSLEDYFEVNGLSDLHLSINQSKKKILDKIIDLFMATIDHSILEYIRKKGWLSPGQFPIKPIKKMVRIMKEMGAGELTRMTSDFVLQQSLNSFKKYIAKKKLNHFEYLFLDIEELCHLLSDDGDNFTRFKATIK